MFDTAQIAAVVFDLFHTLVSLEVPRAPGRATARILGVDEDEWREAWTSDPGDYAVGREDVDGPLRRLARRLNPGVSEAQIAEALATRHKRFGWALENVEDETLAGLRELRGRGYALGLVSNCGRDEVAHWAESPLAALLDCAVFSCEVGLRKPDERIFRLASARLGVRPEECLFVGNGGSDELAGAHRSGMVPVLLTRHLEVIRPERIPEKAKDARLQVRTVLDLCRLLPARIGPRNRSRQTTETQRTRSHRRM